MGARTGPFPRLRARELIEKAARAAALRDEVG